MRELKLTRAYLGRFFIRLSALLASSSFLGARIFPFNLFRFSSTVKVILLPQGVIWVSVFFMSCKLQKGGQYFYVFSFDKEGTDFQILLKRNELIFLNDFCIYVICP
jgi:hypothetical protein